MASFRRLLAVLVVSSVCGGSALRLPLDLFSGNAAAFSTPASLGDSVSPEAARVQIQALLANFSAALRANDSAAAAAIFAPSVALLGPNHPARVLQGLPSQERFLLRLAQCQLRLQLTVADIAVGESAPLPPSSVSSSSSSQLGAISRVNYVAFTSTGGLVDVGKALILWNGSAVPSADSNDESKQYTWQLLSALWSSDVSHEQRLALPTPFSAEDGENEGAEAEAEEEALPLLLTLDESAPTETELIASTQGVVDAFFHAVQIGDIVGASALVAPCFDLLPPGKPRTVLGSTLLLTEFLERLTKSAKEHSLEVQQVRAVSVKERDDANCGVVSASSENGAASASVPALSNDGGAWVWASGVLNETDRDSGEVVRTGKFTYVFRPAPKELSLPAAAASSSGVADRPVRYVIQTVAWNYDAPPSPAPNATLAAEGAEGAGGAPVLGDVKPVDALEQLRDSLSDFTEAVAANDTLAASGLLARTAFVLAPGRRPCHLVTPGEKAAFVAHLAGRQLRLQLTIVDVGVGKPKAFAPIPSQNGDDLIALTYVNYVAFTRGGALADVGKLIILWVKDGLVNGNDYEGAVVSDPPLSWKIYWLAFNSDVTHHRRSGTPAFDPPASLVASDSQAELRDVKPAVVLEQLSSAVADLADALAGNNTFLAARIFAPSALLLPDGEPAKTLTSQEEKEDLFQPLVVHGYALAEEFEEVVLSGLSFLSDSPKGASASTNGDIVFAITRGNYTITANSGNTTEVKAKGHVVQVWERVVKDPATPGKAKATSFGVRWALYSHVPLDKAGAEAGAGTETEAAEAQELPFSAEAGDGDEGEGAAESALRSPKPDVTKADLDASLRNLSRAACPGGEQDLLAILGDNVTLLVGGSDPIFLNSSESYLAFFNSSFLPCGVSFVIADIVVGKGAPAPEPGPAPAPAPTDASNSDDSYLAVTHLLYISYAPELVVGKALALWTLAGKNKLPSAANGVDHYFWNLSAIAWSSNLPETEAQQALASLVPRQMPLSSSSLRREMLQVGDGGAEADGEEGFEEAGGSLSLQNDPPVDVWGALELAIQYFVANASAGDLENATKLWSTVHPNLYLEAGAPTQVYTTLPALEEHVTPYLGYNWTIDILSAWQLSAQESSVSLMDRGGGNAVSIIRVSALNVSTGEIDLYGHSLVLWEGVPLVVRETDNLLGSSKAAQFAVRWEAFAPTAPPATAPAPAPVATAPEEPEPSPPVAPGPKASQGW